MEVKLTWAHGTVIFFTKAPILSLSYQIGPNVIICLHLSIQIQQFVNYNINPKVLIPKRKTLFEI